jgi:hypothetical protein
MAQACRELLPRASLKVPGAMPFPCGTLPQSVLQGLHGELAVRTGGASGCPFACHGLWESTTTLQYTQGCRPIFVPTGVPSKGEPKIGLAPLRSQEGAGLGEALHPPHPNHSSDPPLGLDPPRTVWQGSLPVVHEAQGGDGGRNLLQGHP